MDGAVLIAVSRAEPDAFERCIDLYGPLVWGIARRFCAHEEDARDAVQEVFIELWKCADRYEAARASERTFVAMVARRRMIDRLRSDRRRPAEISFAEEGDARAPADLAHLVSAGESGRHHVPSAGAESASVERLMSHLSEPQRHVLDLSIFHGMSQTEIAEQLALPVGTVKSHARRGLDRIRDSLAAEEGS